MASRGQDFSSGGHAQLKRDEPATQTLNPSQLSRGPHDQSGQDQSSYTAQATNFLQQTGEQVKNMAQGAAEAVKNTLGMNPDNSPNPSSNPTNNLSSNPSTNPSSNLSNNPTTNPSNLSHSINNPSTNPSSFSHSTNPSSNPSHRI